MFELITGTVLFSRDMNLDKLTCEAEKAALIHWTALSSKHQLGLVFKSANATKAQRLFAQVIHKAVAPGVSVPHSARCSWPSHSL